MNYRIISHHTFLILVFIVLSISWIWFIIQNGQLKYFAEAYWCLFLTNMLKEPSLRFSLSQFHLFVLCNKTFPPKRFPVLINPTTKLTAKPLLSAKHFQEIVWYVLRAAGVISPPVYYHVLPWIQKSHWRLGLAFFCALWSRTSSSCRVRGTLWRRGPRCLTCPYPGDRPTGLLRPTTIKELTNIDSLR